jgi:ElaB/YqjD/DUF883 family membrane-anchored ribosome-binding protein
MKYLIAMLILSAFACAVSYSQDKTEIDQLKAELKEMRSELDSLRMASGTVSSDDPDALEDRLEKRIAQVENKVDAVSRNVAPIAFNPKMVTAVNFAARSDNKTVVDPADSSNTISNKPFLRTVEMELSSEVDPYASAFAVISLEDEAGKGFGIDAEEAYGLIKRLPIIEDAPLGLKLKIGKYRASLGLDNKIHIHDLPWTTRPLIVSRYLGTDHGEFFESGYNPVGADLDFYLPNPIPGTTLEMNADAVRASDIAVSNANLPSSAFRTPMSIRQPAYIGHLNLSKDWNNVSLLTLGVSGYDEEGTYATRVYGADITYKWAPSEERESNSIVTGGEIMSIDHVDSLLQRIHPYGWFGYMQYQTSYWLYLGVRYDWIEEPMSVSTITRNVGLYASYYTTEFLRFRLGFEHRQSTIAAEDNVNTILFDLNLVFGSHPTEPYWVNK